MQYRMLGKTGLRVSRVGLGTGGKSVLGQVRGLSESESHAVIHKALDLGIAFFDTSPAYRDSEAILGRALHKNGATDQLVICTKVVPHPESGPRTETGEIQVIAPDAVVHSVERSLQRLHRDHLDILLLHAVLPEAYEPVVEKLYPVLSRLKAQGKIRAIGISEQARADDAQITISRAVRSDLFDVVMLRYNLFHQGGRDRVFPIASEKGIGVLGMCPVDPPITRPAALREWLHELKETGKLGAEALSEGDPVREWMHGEAAVLAEKGMKFATDHNSVDVVITGTANPDHLEQNVQAALGEPLAGEVDTALRRIYGGLDEGRL